MNNNDLQSLIASYESHLRSSIIPNSVISTGLVTSGDFSIMGAERNLLHPHWMLRTGDPKLIASAEKGAIFDAPLGFLLQSTNEILYLSSLRRRLFCLEILKGTGTKRQGTADNTLKRMLDVDWLFRWCNANSIFHFGDLSEAHLEQFNEDSSSGDIMDLLPLTSWLDELLEEPDFELPKYPHGRRYRVNWIQIASVLGVTAKSLALSKRFAQAFEKRFPLFMEKEGIDPSRVTIRFKEVNSAGAAFSGPRRFRGWDTLDRLSANGTLVFDALSFRPEFSQEKNNSGRKRTTALYPRDMMRVLSSASRWVSVYSPFILRALEIRAAAPYVPAKKYLATLEKQHGQLDIDWPSGLPKISIGLSHKVLIVGRILLSEALLMLFVACAIVIGILGGRRRGEVENLLQGSISDGPTGLMLSIYIEKTLRDVDRIPVPEAVRQAVVLLEKLSANARATDNHSFLFRFKIEMADNLTLRVTTRFANHLVKFAEICGLAPPKGE